MKSMKKLVTLLLSLVMLCALAMPAMADEKTYSITINDAVVGHTYTAYQVFKGVYYSGNRQVEGKEAEYLSDVTWGDDVDDTKILKALQESTVIGKDFTDKTSAEEVAYVLQGYDNKSEQLDEFARIVGKNLKTNATGKGSVTVGEDKQATINGLTAGYYFVKDTGKIGDGEIATKFLVKVVGDATVEIKANAPTIEKKIVNGEGDNHTTVNVGDDVEFKLTAKVPDMASFDKYTFTISDTLSNGLTFKKGTVAVTIGDKELVDGTDYTLGDLDTRTNTFTVTFTKDQLAKYVEHGAGATIVVTYKATLNKNALTTDKETNTAKLEYSNNPSGDGTGTVTPDAPVYIYDFDIDIDKYDDTDNKDKDNDNKDKLKKLANAEFILYKEVTENGQKKTYYYKWDKDSNTVKWVPEKAQATPKTTTTEGKASFQGIAAGSYFLEETKAPDGYNKLKDPVPVTITAEYNKDGKLTNTSANANTNAEGQYIQTVEVPNKAGAVLPSTGGIGTTIFYVLGSILALGAAVLLIVKKRMNGQDR